MTNPEVYTARTHQEDMQTYFESELTKSNVNLSRYNELLGAFTSYDQIKDTVDCYVASLNVDWQFHDSYVTAIGVWKGFDRSVGGTYARAEYPDAGFAGLAISKGFGILEKDGKLQIGYKFVGIVSEEGSLEGDIPHQLYDIVDPTVSMFYAGKGHSDNQDFAEVMDNIHKYSILLKKTFDDKRFYKLPTPEQVKAVDAILDEANNHVITPHYALGIQVTAASCVYTRSDMQSPYGYGRLNNVLGKSVWDINGNLRAVTSVEREVIASGSVRSRYNLNNADNGLHLVIQTQDRADVSSPDRILFVPYQNPARIELVSLEIDVRQHSF